MSQSLPSTSMSLEMEGSSVGNQLHGSTIRQEKSRLKHDSHREGIKTYVRMREQGLRPSIETVLTALKGCSSLGDQETGRRIHMDVLENGDFLHQYVTNSVVNMYAKCGSMEEARMVFESIHCRDVVSWTAIILGYVESGEGEVALELYQRMHEEGCPANRVTVLAALKACACSAEKEEGQLVDGKLLKLRCLEKGRLIHSQSRSRGIQLDLFGNNTLMDMYAKCGSMGEARKVFNEMPHHNVVAWSCLIQGYAQANEGTVALQLFQRMQDEGCQPDGVTFLAALKACCSLSEQEQPRLIEGKLIKVESMSRCRAIHLQALQTGCYDKYVANRLMDLYAKCGSMTEAREIFNRMKQRDLVAWNTIILGYAESGYGGLALQLFSRMKYEGCCQDRVTLVAALKACTCLAEQGLQPVREIHAQASATNLLETVVSNTLIDSYAKCGSLSEALNVFRSMTERTAVSWNCIISACAQSGEAKLAMGLYTDMQHAGFTPNRVSVLGVLRACGNIAALDVGKEIQAGICSTGLPADAAVATRLVDFYGKCGRIADAERLLFSSAKNDLVTWSALIAGYGSQGNTNRVFELFERMQKEERLKPDAVIYLCVLSACRHAGLVDRGREYFEEMRGKHEIVPGVKHYTCMVDLLGRANRLEEAMELVRNMPCKGDVVMWLAVLTCAWKWGNVEIGKEAFETILEIDLKQSSAYVLMANIYAAAEMWDDVFRIQQQQKYYIN